MTIKILLVILAMASMIALSGIHQQVQASSCPSGMSALDCFKAGGDVRGPKGGFEKFGGAAGAVVGCAATIAAGCIPGAAAGYEAGKGVGKGVDDLNEADPSDNHEVVDNRPPEPTGQSSGEQAGQYAGEQAGQYAGEQAGRYMGEQIGQDVKTYTLPSYVQTSGGIKWSTNPGDPSTWSIISMKDPDRQGQFKVIDEDGKNVAANFKSHQEAIDYIKAQDRDNSDDQN